MAIDLRKLTKSTCLQCGSEAYKCKGKVYKLCAKCGLDAILDSIEYSNESEANCEMESPG